MRRAIGISVLLLGCVYVRSASAYRNASELPSINCSEPVRWPGDYFEYVVNKRTPTGVATSDYVAAIDRALSTWTEPECTSVALHDLGLTAGPAKAGDGLNTIEWVQQGWVERGYEADVPGQTDVSYEKDSSGNWVIKEADIYLNGESNTWDLSGETGVAPWNIRSVLIHEGGHALGLLHPCELGETNTAPLCTDGDAFTGLAMHPVFNPSLSRLEGDDRAGICAVYPVASCQADSCKNGEVCTVGVCAEACGNRLCGIGEACISGMCQASVDNAESQVGFGKGVSCSASRECRRGLSCSGGICKGGPSKLGDPCEKDKQCEDGVCSKAGYCAESCVTSDGCSAWAANCEEKVAGVGACKSKAGGLGTACDSADDCVAGKCLLEDGEAPICSRSCDSSRCVSGWHCSDVETERVCVPPNPTDGCSCSAARRKTKGGDAATALLLVALMTAVLRGKQGLRGFLTR